MSETLDCDPNKGFIAFPVAVFDLELTPGAFRTLAELCRMANTNGQCWPSLAQLGRRLGRSRASVSSYIAELRGAGVLTTEEQKMANGYNYRLRYTVTFWKDWRADLSKGKQVAAQPVQRSERRVQPAERPLRTKNHIHKKQTTSVELTNLVSEWKSAVKRAPYPDFTSWPSAALITKTTEVIDKDLESSPLISADIQTALERFYRLKGVQAAEDVDIEVLKKLISSNNHLESVISNLDEGWQPHWRKGPSTFQLKRLINNMPPQTNSASQQKLLKSYLRRWKLHEQRLLSPALRSNVAA